MTEPEKIKMNTLKEKMTRKVTKTKSAPVMVDLFGRLRTKQGKERDIWEWNWQENKAYAPDIINGSPSDSDIV